MQEGIILELTQKDSGFIGRKGHAENLFFHADHLLGTTFESLHKGDTLRFTVRDTNKGPYAIDITKV